MEETKIKFSNKQIPIYKNGRLFMILRLSLPCVFELPEKSCARINNFYEVLSEKYIKESELYSESSDNIYFRPCELKVFCKCTEDGAVIKFERRSVFFRYISARERKKSERIETDIFEAETGLLLPEKRKKKQKRI